MAEKYRYAECILYPENMREDWKDKIDFLIQMPFAYCVHDQDLGDDEDETHGKVHVHLILVHNNTVALTFFVKWCNLRLSAEGKKCCSTAKPIIYPKQAWNYLIHDTDKAREQGKFQYPQSSRVCGNDFDIHHFIQLDENTKLAIVEKITDHILDYNIMDLTSLVPWIRSQGIEFFSVFVSRSSYFDRICGGNFKKWERSKSKKD